MKEVKISKRFTGRKYEIVAWANDQEVVLYKEYGGYSGEWLLVSRDEENYYIYKDYFGSCSVCDPFQSFFSKWYANDELENIPKEKAKEFAKDYPPYLIIPRTRMIDLVKNKSVLRILPANLRCYCDISQEQLKKFAEELEACIKELEEIEN